MKIIEAVHSSQKRILDLFNSPVGISTIAGLLFALLCVSGWTNARHTEAMSVGVQQGGRDEIRIELGNNGFTPSQVQHVPGSFAIAVDNSVASAYKLRLKAEDGTVLHEVEIQKGSLAWTVNLQTGRYTLTEVDHSQWLCSIVVQ